MPASNTIREFLVGLGVEINTSDVNRFVSAVDNMTKEVTRFSLKLFAMTTKLQAAVTKAADALENLYYIAQRAGTTVNNLKSLEFAMAQVGLSAEDANAALEHMAMALRINPGNESLLRFLGVATRNLGGGMRDTSLVMTDFLARLGKMPFYIAAQYAAMFGINERTLFMLLRDFRELGQAQEKWKNLAKQTGTDLDASGKAGRNFMNTLRETGEIIELMWLKVATVLLVRLQPQLERFNKFLLANAKEIEHFAISVGVALMDTAGTISEILPQINQLVKDTIGWKNVLTVIGDIIVYRIFGPIGLALLLFKQLQDVREKNRVEQEKIPGVPNPTQEQRDQRKEEQEKVYRERDAYWHQRMIDSLFEFFKSYTDSMVQLQKGPGFDPRFIHPASYSPDSQTPSAGPVTPAPMAARLDPRIEFEVRRQARLQNVDEEHMVNLARVEHGGFDKVSPAGAIGPMQLMPKTAQGLGVDPWNWMQNIAGGIRYFAEQLKRFGSYSAADAAYNAGPRGRGVEYFALTGDPRFLPRETQRYVLGLRGGGQRGEHVAPTINQKTDIHVHGSEPHATAKEIHRQQDHVNADLVRNFRSAVLA